MGRSYCEACISGTRGSDCLGSKSTEVGASGKRQSHFQRCGGAIFGCVFLVAYFFLPLDFGLLTSPKKSKYGRSAAGPLRVLPPMVMAWVVLVVLRQRPCRRQRRPMRSLHGSRTGRPKQNPQDDFH